MQEVRKQFAKLHNDFQVRIDNAPTPRLKQAFERGQGELKDAYAILNESDTVDDTRSLPHSERTFDDGIEASSEEGSVPGVDRALSLFGVGKAHSVKEIEAAMHKRLTKVREQHESADLAAAKDVYKQEIAKLEKAQNVIINWLAEKNPVEQAQIGQAGAMTSTAATAHKKSRAWWYLVPLLLMAAGVIYYIGQQSGTQTSDAGQALVTAGKDSSAWKTAVAVNNEAAYKYYLKEFPEGIFAKVAMDSLVRFTGAKGATSLSDTNNHQPTADHMSRTQEPLAAAGERKRQDDAKKAVVPVPEMVFVAGGSFQMGRNKYSSEQPVHTVRLSSYSIGKYEVTFDEYDAFCTATGRSKPRDQGWGRGKRPVIMVSWHDAVAYCSWLSDKTGRTYRLPTEAEWEYAARGGNSGGNTEFSGSGSIGSVAWYIDNSGDKTHPVGQKSPNELGLYDMCGNVEEWCSDWYGADYYANSPVSNPKGPSSGGDRVLRGGSWSGTTGDCNVAFRGRDRSVIGNIYYGFRVVRSE